jgi:hypothetical protein
VAELRIDTLTTQFGRWRLQWREDGRWRQVDANQSAAEEVGEYTSEDGDWSIWTGAADGVTGRAEVPEGRDEPTWWLLYGELPAVGEVRVRSRDGTELPVRTVGRVWACEWHSLKEPVTVQIGDLRRVHEFPRRFYLGDEDADAEPGT